jgi:hypothetical protein
VIRRLLLILVGAISALAWGASAVAIPTATGHAYRYNVDLHPAVTAVTPAERGPPAHGYAYATNCGAVDHRSRDASACSETTAVPAYDAEGQPVHGAHVGCAGISPLDQVRPSDGDPARLATTGVAANAGGRVAPDLLRGGDLKLPADPKGAVCTPTQTGKGMEYVIPRGTPEISEKVASVRIMDPVTSGKYQYPNGYAVYMNSSGQTINPLTGQTIARTDPYAHIPLP